MNTEEPTAATVDPGVEYQRRIAAHRSEVTRLAGLDRLLSVARMVIFVSVIAAAWFAWGPAGVTPGIVVPPIVVFVALLLYHERVVAALRRGERSLTLYERGLDRIAGSWYEHGARGERFSDPQHPYAGDLDLFGEGSLFQLLCRARTAAGEELLATWLRAPASVDEIRARQHAVRELQPAIDLRADLALLGDDVRVGVTAEELDAWGKAAPPGFSPAAPWLAGGLAATLIATLVGWMVGGDKLYVVAAILAEVAFAAFYHERVEAVLASVEQPAKELALLSALLARIERIDATSPRLGELHERLVTAGAPASIEIARLHRLISLADSRRNQMFAPIALATLWGTQFAIAIERWRTRCGPALAGWVAVIAEVEALSSFAWHGFEHPADTFPDVATGAPSLRGTALAHPLLTEQQAVANDIAIGGDLRLFIISGSNMSGKSTFMRTVGCNVVLALAGAPVRARELSLTPFQIGASIRVQDSLRDGTSRFYAEIKRLRQIMELTNGRLPLLFVLDEVLHGTNSHDRRIGATAVVRGLVERGALGFVTTHDLALAQIAEDEDMRARNVHFEDRLESDRILFDYELRDGVVERSNAIELMRAIGLEV